MPFRIKIFGGGTSLLRIRFDEWHVEAGGKIRRLSQKMERVLRDVPC
jgi:hypothetical protein